MMFTGEYFIKKRERSRMLIMHVISEPTSTPTPLRSKFCGLRELQRLLLPRNSYLLEFNLTCSHACIMGYAIVMGALSVAFHYIGISMGWLYEFMGILLGAAVAPIALCIISRKANKWGCIIGAVFGFVSGLIGKSSIRVTNQF
jgi:hypothetical protein